MPSKSYLMKVLEMAKQYLPAWLWREVMFYARAHAGGKARHQVSKLYEDEDQLPAAVKKLPAKKRRKWMSVFNNAYCNAPEGQDPEKYAFAAAWSAVRKEDVAEEHHIRIMKTDQEKRLVYGVVYEPDVEDSQGDVASAEEIEKAAHRFMIYLQEGVAFVDVQHNDQPADAVVVESYIAPVDFQFQGSSEAVRKGSWVVVTHIVDEQLWKAVKSELKGYSMAGFGKRD